MSALSTGILSNPEALEAIVPAWWSLWHRCPQATPFQSPAWLVPWWRHFRPGELFVLVAWQGDRLVGLAPFYREDGALGRRLLPVGISVSDYHDMVLDPADAREIGEALIREALRRWDGWERWDWEELPPDATSLTLSFPPECSVEASIKSACPVLVLDGESLTHCLPSRKRRDVNLARNRANRRGGFSVEHVGAIGLETALDHLFRLHASLWESRGEAGVLAGGPVQAFHREAARGLIEAGLLRMYVLHIAGSVAAVFYGFRRHERTYAYLTGLDPAFQHESPGVIVIAHAIEDTLREGGREFHFLRGQETYKYRWGAVDRWNRHLSIRRNETHDAAA